MRFLAAIVLEPGGIVAWLVVGLIAGFLAGKFMRGAGFGLVGDIVVGLIGALLGGFVFGLFGTTGEGFWGSILVAFVGACLLIVLARVVARRNAPL